jgi:hypothetical protein
MFTGMLREVTHRVCMASNPCATSRCSSGDNLSTRISLPDLVFSVSVRSTTAGRCGSFHPSASACSTPCAHCPLPPLARGGDGQ